MDTSPPAGGRQALPAPAPMRPGRAWTALAPMQDVTTLPFMRLLGRYGPPDLLFTEYFRVHAHSRLEPHIVASIREHETGRPVFAQLIGENLEDLKRTVRAIRDAELPVAGIDLNMGCPAPKVYKKNVGGGLLREPATVERIFRCLREAVDGRFTVKMRIGFEDDRHFDAMLDLVTAYGVDLLSLHARTVREAYRGEAHYEYVARAADRAPCPVLANGNITSVARGQWVLDTTGAAGLMIGRSCIRNPWIFRQFREHFSGEPIFRPTLSNIRDYVEDLYSVTDGPGLEERQHVNRMKKFLNFVGVGVDTEGNFLHEMRRAKSRNELNAICDRHLVDNGRAASIFPEEPIKGLIARPNCEAR
ncbi:MAG: tRNA dihydrouridine synthase [Opitutales bacterium]